MNKFLEEWGYIALPEHLSAKIQECLIRMLQLKTSAIGDVRYLGSSITPSGQAAALFVLEGYTKGKFEKGSRKYTSYFVIFLPELVEDVDACAARAITDADKSIRELLESEKAKGDAA